ncbi:MAG: hypothetical protein ACQERN_02550 [Thermodesulfobacteriota bacterium]
MGYRRVGTRKNYRKRTNYVIAVFFLVLFYMWLSLYAHSPESGNSSRIARQPAEGNDRAAVDSAPARPGSESSAAEKKGLFDAFPADIPVYKPSKVSTSGGAARQANARVVLTTGKAIATVSDFYRAAVRRHGWGITEERFVGSGKNRRAAFRVQGVKDKRQLTVDLLSKPPGTEICLRFGPRRGVQ